jgi:uncharacterized protein YuzE
MKLSYYPETDSLYIDLSEKTSVESKEISEGVVLDYDADGKLVGIDIDNASTKVQLKELNLRKPPADINAGGPSEKWTRHVPIVRESRLRFGSV